MICVVKKLDIGKMYAVEKLSSYITRGVYTVSGPFHPFGGAVDIIVVQQPDGTFKSSPWYVRFGKFQGVLKTKEKVVNICVNGVDAGFHMYLDHKGEAYFLKESDSEEGGEFVISPPSSGDEMDEKARSVRFEKAQSCNFDGEPRELVASVENGSGKIVARTNSRRSRIFGLMFGKRSTKENDQAANVERVSSLERAEIAADLLEMKWSTNLPSADCRADNSMEDLSEKIDFDARIVDNEMISPHGEGIDDNFGAGIVCGKHFEEVSIHNSPSIRADEEDLEINTSTLGTDGINIVLKESFNKNLIGDYPSSGLSTYDTFNESVGSCGEKAGDSFETNMVREVHFEETVTDRTPCLSSHEEVLETYTFETGDLGNRSEAISNSVKIESDECNVSSKRSLLNCSKFDSQSTSSTAVPNDKEEALDEKSDGEKEVTSFIYSETFESSTVRFDVSADQAHDTLNLSFGGDGQFEHHSEVLCKTSELICEVNSQPESDESTCKENYNGHHYQNLELFKLEGSSVFQNIQSDSPSNGVLQETITNGLNADPPSISHSSESEVICRERATEELSQKKETRNKPIEFIRNRSQIKEGKSTELISHIPVSNEKSELQSNCTFTDSFILDCQAHEVENLGNGVNVEKSCLPNGVKESLEDEQFLFSDNDSFDARDIDPDVPLNDAAVETDDHLLLTIEGDVEEHGLEDTNHEQSFEIISEVSGTNTSSIAIPRSKSHLGETNLLTKSVPIIRSHIHDIERSNLLHPLSCSLDLNSEKYEKDLQRIEISSSSKLKADSEGNVIEDNCTSEAAGTAVNAENEQKQDGTPINPAVELSLCKHLLFEGMGADAACRVFNAEKVNFEKFSTLGPSLVKNDRLVVKIGSRYFPWDAAAPIILGMASFGQEHIFEPQGMIAVDRDEKNLKGDPSRAIVPSGGSWRLWPFTFKKSKTISTVRSVPESTNRANVNAAPMKTQSLIGDDDIQRSKYIKKKVRSLTPTSEELASLNLKEGRNVVTFSFSTAMLGQQQVDARIYLWKWNTRIVISDVDGTITKSDVLGQFMPLVGIDWSQTGVAHLFSAIKENGYQLLFLSARAISQAYLTRQFLFNLKQDGKALPDGPVVISPDGLFPSLYREVIRRAPHEFKISCLEDIRVLFPPECNPFYAGFGNRDTDEISYVKVGIPKGKIFIINPKGEVAVNRRIDTRSYTSLHALVNSMFPPMSSAEQEDFNSWNYWKIPLPDVDI